MNAELSRLAMICICTILSLALVGGTVALSLVARKDPERSTVAMLGLVQDGNSIRLLTTFGVILVTTFLALAGSLTEGAIALLSSVGGFMLGGIRGHGGEGARREGADSNASRITTS